MAQNSSVVGQQTLENGESVTKITGSSPVTASSALSRAAAEQSVAEVRESPYAVLTSQVLYETLREETQREIVVSHFETSDRHSQADVAPAKREDESGEFVIYFPASVIGAQPLGEGGKEAAPTLFRAAS